MKKCRTCKETLPLTSFYKSARNKGGISTECKDCHHKRNNDWTSKNRDRQKNSHLKCTYSITLDDYSEMLDAQGGKCAICGVTQCKMQKHFAVDHCHTTGKIRGLLCGKCNTAIGKFNDNIELLKKAILYLQNTKA